MIPGAPLGGTMATRIGAMVLRHAYLLRTSWPRVFEMMYWPTIQMVLWGFITVFLAMTNSSYIAQAAGVLISAVLLWDVLFRGQLGFSLSFLEEIWSRNLANLAVSPLRPGEFLVALMTMSVIRTLIGVLPAAGLAIVFYEVSVFDLGLPLLAFFVNLMVMGWAIGMLVSALILRVGLGAESVAWLAIFLIAPVSAIYYPSPSCPIGSRWSPGGCPRRPFSRACERSCSRRRARRPAVARRLARPALPDRRRGDFSLRIQVARRRGLLLQIGE